MGQPSASLSFFNILLMFFNNQISTIACKAPITIKVLVSMNVLQDKIPFE